MERNINDLTGYRVDATDGEIGKVEDFYFDDEFWTIRYLVIRTGNWLSRKKVLISTSAFTSLDTNHDLLQAGITKEQVANSLDIDINKPVSRRQEALLNQHYSWENYWGSDFNGGEMGILNQRPIRLNEACRNSKEDIHLRSVAKVNGYTIHASDGEMGHVNSFIVDYETWQMVHVVVDIHNWIGGEKVLIEVANLHSISFLNQLVYVHMNIADITAGKLYVEAEYSQKAQHSEDESLINR